jgi:hypothetical protein
MNDPVGAALMSLCIGLAIVVVVSWIGEKLG